MGAATAFHRQAPRRPDCDAYAEAAAGPGKRLSSRGGGGAGVLSGSSAALPARPQRRGSRGVFGRRVRPRSEASASNCALSESFGRMGRAKPPRERPRAIGGGSPPPPASHAASRAVFRPDGRPSLALRASRTGEAGEPDRRSSASGRRRALGADGPSPPPAARRHGPSRAGLLHVHRPRPERPDPGARPQPSCPA